MKNSKKEKIQYIANKFKTVTNIEKLLKEAKDLILYNRTSIDYDLKKAEQAQWIDNFLRIRKGLVRNRGNYEKIHKRGV